MRYKVLINTINKQIIIYDGFDKELAYTIFGETKFNQRRYKYIECESFEIGKENNETKAKYYLTTAHITDVELVITND